MHTAEETYTMLGNENLWKVAAQCHQVLAAAKIPHSVCGGVAVCLHGYQRNTIDLDLIIEPERAADVKPLPESAGLQWDAVNKEFRTIHGIAEQFLMTGDRAGNGSEVLLPSPSGELTWRSLKACQYFGYPDLSKSKSPVAQKTFATCTKILRRLLS